MRLETLLPALLLAAGCGRLSYAALEDAATDVDAEPIDAALDAEPDGDAAPDIDADAETDIDARLDAETDALDSETDALDADAPPDVGPPPCHVEPPQLYGIDGLELVYGLFASDDGSASMVVGSGLDMLCPGASSCVARFAGDGSAPTQTPYVNMFSLFYASPSFAVFYDIEAFGGFRVRRHAPLGTPAVIAGTMTITDGVIGAAPAPMLVPVGETSFIVASSWSTGDLQAFDAALIPAGAASAAFVTHATSAGHAMWTRVFDGPGSEQLQLLGADAAGRVTLVVYSSAGVCDEGSCATNPDQLLVDLDVDGSTRRASVVRGLIEGRVTPDGHVLTRYMDRIEISTAGGLLDRTLVLPDGVSTFSLSSDGAHFAIAGLTSTTFSYDGTTFVIEEPSTPFVLVFTIDGELLWGELFGPDPTATQPLLGISPGPVVWYVLSRATSFTSCQAPGVPLVSSDTAGDLIVVRLR